MAWIKQCLLLLSIFVTVTAEAPSHVTVELLLEDGAKATNSSQSTLATMPSNLVFRVRRDHEVAILRLRKIPLLKTIACREGGSFPLIHTREDKASYVDYSTKAVLLVTRAPTSSTKYILEGHFQIGLRLVHIEPSSEGVHEVIRQETLKQRFQDMYQEHEAHHRYKRSLRTYTVETCLIADYQAFFNFLGRNNNDLAKAEADMRNYYAFIAEQMKVRYQHINEVEGTIAFNIVYSGLIILENRADSSYSEPYKQDGKAEVGEVLNATQYWLESPPSGIVLPPSDHYMFFTGYDLLNNGNDGNVGRAFTATVCIADSYAFSGTTILLKGSTSIVEDRQGAETAITATHELGHALNANHDRDVGCNDQDQYIMASSSTPVLDSINARHPWQFSTCSIRDIKAFVERADVDCLNDNRYGDGVVSTTETAGQYYDKDTQCKMMKGEDSFFCSFIYSADKDKMCYLGYCFIADGTNQCGTVNLMEYSTCDTNKWCYKGLCINASNSAPIFVNVPTSPVPVASNAQGVIYTVQTFDVDADTLTLHITYDPSNVESYLTYDTTTKKFSVRSGSNLADIQLSNFSLIMSVDDGLLLSLPVNVDFQITAPITNQPPSFTQSSYNFTVNEGKAGAVVVSSLLNRVTDPDANTQFLFILQLVTTYSVYFSIDPSTGRISYAKDYDYDPIRLPNKVQLSVEVRDQTGFSDTATIFLTILNVDTPPIFQNLPATVNLPENTAPGTLIFNVSATDNDSTDTIQFLFLTSNSFISTYLDLNINTGVIRLKAGSNLNYENLAITTFQIRIRALTAQASRDATLTIIVTDVNEPPKFTRSSYGVTTTTGPKDQVVVERLTGVVSDPDFGDRIVQFGIEPGQYVYLFNIDSTTGRITFSQEYGVDRSMYPRQVALVVTATDTTGLKGTAVYTITVNIGNRKPKLTNLPSTKSVLENTAGGTSIFQAFAEDLDGDSITFSLQASFPANQNQFTLSSGGEVSVRSGAVIDFESLPELMYLTIVAFDGKASSTAVNLTLVITNVNEPPSFNQTRIGFNVNEGRVGQLLVPGLLSYIRDPDRGESFTFAITPTNSYFFINSITGAISYNQNYDTDPKRLPSTVQLTVTAKDSGGNIASTTILLTIQNVNQPPKFTNLPKGISIYAATTPNGSVIFNVGVTDADTQDTLTIGTNFLTTEASRFFSYRSSDRAVLFKDGSFIALNSTFIIRFSVSDGQSSISSDLNITVIAPIPTTTPAPTTTQSPLEITNLPNIISIKENTDGVVFMLNINRASGSSITYQLVQVDTTLPQLFEINNVGVVSVKTGVTIDFETLPNRITLSITAMEGATKSSPKNLTIMILNLNEVPQFSQSEYNFTVDEGKKDTMLIPSFLPYVTDPDSGDSFTFNTNFSPYSNYFTIDMLSGRLAYALDYDADPKRLPNQVVLSIVVTDSGNLTDTAIIRLNIRNINQRPEFTNLPTSHNINSAFTSGIFYTVSATDQDSGDGLTVSMVSSAYFSFNQSGNTISFLGRQGLSSTQNFQLTFTVTDGQLSSSAILTVTVIVDATTTTIRPLAFTNLPQAITLAENTANNPVFIVRTNEPDISKLTFQMESSPAGDFQINNKGEVSLRPGAILDYERFTSGFLLPIACSDDGMVTYIREILRIVVLDMNEPPTFSQEEYNFTAFEGKSGTVLVTSLSTSVSDQDANERLSFSLLTSSYSQYFSIDPANGRISFATDYDADPKRLPFNVMLTVKVLDKGNLEDTARVRFQFTNINQPPSFTNLPSTRTIETSIAAGVVFSVTATDPDTSDTLAVTVTYTNPTDANLFSFNPSSGDVSFTRNTGISTNQTYTITFTVNDGKTSESSKLTFLVLNSPETTNRPVTTTARPLRLTNLPTTIYVKENSINGVFVVSTDAIPSTNLSFSLNSPYFNISDDGTVAVKPDVKLDYETSPSVYQLKITANDGVVASPEETLVIQLLDVNEPPRFNTTYLSFSTNEGKAGDPVVESLLPFVRDEDKGDTLKFEFLPRGTYKDFLMNPATGGFVFAKEHDVFNGMFDRLGLNVKVTDSGLLSAEAYIELTINFVNQAPKFVNLPNSLTIPSTTTDGQRIFTVKVADTDMWDTITVNVNVLTPEASQFFNFSKNEKEVGVIFKNGVNIASDSEFHIQFIAMDGRFIVNSTLNITVTFIPIATTTQQPTTTEQPPAPAFNQSRYSFSVNEGKNGEVVIPSLRPFMMDPNQNREYKFSIFPSAYSDAFNINVSTGEITFASNYDLTLLPSNINLNILVSDSSNSIQFASAVVNLVIMPPTTKPTEPPTSKQTEPPTTQPTEPQTTKPTTTTQQPPTTEQPPAPAFNQSRYSFSVNEGKNGEVVIPTLRPFMMDSNQNREYKFSIFPSAYSDAFNINVSTGEISFASNYDLTRLPSNINLNIVVSDSSNSIQLASALVNLVIVPPTTKPTEPPTTKPTEPPTTKPTEPPTSTPTEQPTTKPTEPPTTKPTEPPTSKPTEPPTSKPTEPPTSTPTEQPTTKPTEPPTTKPTEPPTSKPTEPPTSKPTEPPTSKPTEPPTSKPTEPPTTKVTDQLSEQTTPVTTSKKPSTKPPAVPSDSDSLLNRPWAISAIIIVVVLVPVIIVIVLCLVCRKTKTKDGSTEKIYDTRSTGTRSIPISYYPKYSFKSGETRMSGVKPHHYPFDSFKQPPSLRSKASSQSR